MILISTSDKGEKYTIKPQEYRSTELNGARSINLFLELLQKLPA